MRPVLWVLPPGIVAGVLAACSSTPRQPRSDVDIGIASRYVDEAAKLGCQWLWEHEPDSRKWEYCAALYQDADGMTRVTMFMTKYRHTCGSPEGPPFAPEGTLLVGKAHNHLFEPEPSRTDMLLAAKYPLLAYYLCSPSGIVRRLSAKEGTVIVK